MDRLFDLLPVFRAFYFHPSFRGSYAIKSVLLVLIPGLSYANDDDVHDGLGAQVVWNSLISRADEMEKSLTEKSLKDYCNLDTLAMVEMYRHVRELAYGKN